MYTRCPKCGHAPLPVDQSLPAACAACGVILAKVGGLPGARPLLQAAAQDGGDAEGGRHGGWLDALGEIPERVEPAAFWFRVVLLAAFAVWGMVLIAQDHRSGEFGATFLHRPLLIFHEAGHVVFSAFGHWIGVAGGTLGQLLMPLVMAFALLRTNRDPYGASFGVWLFGVSLLDVAPYMYDALQPRLVLLNGFTGEQGGHDWIFLFSSLGLLGASQQIGGLTHKLGALVIVLSLAWGAWLLRRQSRRIAGDRRTE